MSLGDFVLWVDGKHWQEWSITLDGDLRFGRSFHRWKAETEGFPTVKGSSKTEITIESNGPFLPMPAAAP